MRWCRMAVVAWRLAWPEVLRPWRSPLLRWRIETYGMLDGSGRLLHAGEITPRRFFAFLCAHLKAVARFLKWAALL